MASVQTQSVVGHGLMGSECADVHRGRGGSDLVQVVRVEHGHQVRPLVVAAVATEQRRSSVLERHRPRERRRRAASGSGLGGGRVEENAGGADGGRLDGRLTELAAIISASKEAGDLFILPSFISKHRKMGLDDERSPRLSVFEQIFRFPYSNALFREVLLHVVDPPFLCLPLLLVPSSVELKLEEAGDGDQ